MMLIWQVIQHGQMVCSECLQQELAAESCQAFRMRASIWKLSTSMHFERCRAV